jgi:hypothetical protein
VGSFRCELEQFVRQAGNRLFPLIFQADMCCEGRIVGNNTQFAYFSYARQRNWHINLDFSGALLLAIHRI